MYISKKFISKSQIKKNITKNF